MLLSRRQLLNGASVIAIASVGAGWFPHGVYNSGKVQVNFGLQGLFDGSFPFINYLKLGAIWQLYDNSGTPSPASLDTNGYPLSGGITNGGVRSIFPVPSTTEYSGGWVLKWTGTGTLAFTSTAITTTGSLTGTNGRVTATLNNSSVVAVTVAITATDSISPITNIVFCRADEESLYDAGQVFSPNIKRVLRNFGVIRFMDLSVINISNVVRWSHRKPVNYYSYGQADFRNSIFAGTTTDNGSGAFAINYSFPDGNTSPKQGDILTFFSSAAMSQSGGVSTSTLNVNSTGALPLWGAWGQNFGFGAAGVPFGASKYVTVVFDQDINSGSGAWCITGISTNSIFLINAWPPEIQVQLCNEVGAHPWFNIPYFACGGAPISDYTSSLAAYCKSNLISGLAPRFEPGNEVWNTAAGFVCGPYADTKATAVWGLGANNHDQFYGRMVSLVGQAVSSVYSNDRTKYQVICAVWTGQPTGTPGNNTGGQNTRLTAQEYVDVNGGDPAYKWATHIAQTTYYSPTATLTAELGYAYTYATGSPTDAAAALQSFVNTVASASFPGNTWLTGTGIPGWAAWAAGPWGSTYVLGQTAYEGGYSPDYPSSNTTVSITGISQASQAVVTLGGSVTPPVGSSLSFASVGGMTQVNGNTYTVVSVAGQLVTINVDSTGFSAYTSGGTATFVNSLTNRTALRAASKYHADIYGYELGAMNAFKTAGAKFPSQYALSGKGIAWSIYDPDIYAVPTPRWAAIQTFNAEP